MTDRRRAIVLTAYFAGQLLVTGIAWFELHGLEHQWGILLLVLQGGLISTWAALGTMRLADRATFTAFTIVALAFMAAILDESVVPHGSHGSRNDRHVGIAFSAQFLLLAVVLGGYRRLKQQVVRLHCPGLETPRPGQFSLKDILYATVVIAVVFGAGRAIFAAGDWQTSPYDARRDLEFYIIGCCAAGVNIAAVWAAMTTGRARMRILAYAALTAALAVVLIILFGEIPTALMLAGLIAFPLANLLVFRYCGYRLAPALREIVVTFDSPTSQAELPTDRP